jgi:hypothetical protein
MTRTTNGHLSWLPILPLGALFAAALTALIRWYWIARALGTPGANGMALYAFVLPASGLAFWVVGVLIWRLAAKSERSARTIWGAILLSMLIVLVLGFTLEVWRTRDLPSGSQSSAGLIFRTFG